MTQNEDDRLLAEARIERVLQSYARTEDRVVELERLGLLRTASGQEREEWDE